MTLDEYSEAYSLLLDHKYDYVSGRLPIPPLVGQILMSYYLWPYEDEEEFYMTDEKRIEFINSHCET
jgi:hypothetical protein